ncbi:MAG: hypothetical protein ACRD6N_02400, partial [Pyrinomonadaceae bacterium]
DKTRIFMTEVESWIKQHQSELPRIVTAQDLRDFKRSYLSNNEEVSLRTFAVTAFGDQHPKLSTSLVTHLREKGLKDPRFKVHQKEWARHSNKLTYRLTRDNKTVEIRGDLEAVKTLVKITEPTKNNPHYRATITADSLEEVP